MLSEKKRLEHIILKLRETLKYYANEELYEFKEYGYQLVAELELDRGDNAKNALKKYTKNYKPKGEVK